MNVDVVIPRATFQHLQTAVGDDEAPFDPYGMVLESEHATALANALMLALGALSPQPAELAGQAIAQMVRERDTGALKRLKEHVEEELAGLGVTGDR